jgi:hypothetical protein
MNKLIALSVTSSRKQAVSIPHGNDLVASSVYNLKKEAVSIGQYKFIGVRDTFGILNKVAPFVRDTTGVKHSVPLAVRDTSGVLNPV